MAFPAGSWRVRMASDAVGGASTQGGPLAPLLGGMTRTPLHQFVERLQGNSLFSAHIEGEDIVITGRDPYLGRTVRIEAEMATSPLNRLGHGGLVRHITAALVEARPAPPIATDR